MSTWPGTEPSHDALEDEVWHEIHRACKYLTANTAILQVS